MTFSRTRREDFTRLEGWDFAPVGTRLQTRAESLVRIWGPHPAKLGW